MVKTSDTAGFTLLEVLAVLAIVALVMAVALPRIGFNASPAATEALGFRIISVLDADRYAARRRGIASVSEIDTQNNLIRLSSRREAYTLPNSVKLGIRSAPPCDPTGRRITFYPDGTSCAPLITIASATSTRIIAINPLTGAISLGE